MLRIRKVYLMVDYLCGLQVPLVHCEQLDAHNVRYLSVAPKLQSEIREDLQAAMHTPAHALQVPPPVCLRSVVPYVGGGEAK